MTFPTLDSFACLQPATREALAAVDEFGESALCLAFSAGRFPTWFRTDFDPEETRTYLRDVFANRTNLVLDDCHTYNRWMVAHGHIPRAPLTIRGKCVKPAVADKHPDCKHFHRHTCGGCGRVWLPGSLKDPACVVYEDPWWMEYIGDTVRSHIASAGGVSKTDPLVWFPAGPRRNGRLERYDPDTEPTP